MIEKFFVQYPFLRYVSSILIMAILFHFSSKSGSDISLPTGVDKILHAIAYTGLGISFAFWFRPARWKLSPFLISLAVIFLTLLYGCVDEFHQSFTPGRFVSGYDIIADGVGAIFAVLIYHFYLRCIVFRNRLKK